MIVNKNILWKNERQTDNATILLYIIYFIIFPAELRVHVLCKKNLFTHCTKIIDKILNIIWIFMWKQNLILK